LRITPEELRQLAIKCSLGKLFPACELFELVKFKKLKRIEKKMLKRIECFLNPSASSNPEDWHAVLEGILPDVGLYDYSNFLSLRHLIRNY